jgi:hypothetical protein
MIFRKKKIRDEKYFEEFLKSLSAYELTELLKAIAKFSNEMMKIKGVIPKNKDFKGFA